MGLDLVILPAEVDQRVATFHGRSLHLTHEDRVVAGLVTRDEATLHRGQHAVEELPQVTAPELAERLRAEPDLVVLDVREPVEWEEGHVPGARHIPMREVPGRLAELPRDRRIALICRGGARSSLVGSVLLSHGFTDLLNTWGGVSAWLEAGLPVTQD